MNKLKKKKKPNGEFPQKTDPHGKFCGVDWNKG